MKSILSEQTKIYKLQSKYQYSTVSGIFITIIAQQYYITIMYQQPIQTSHRQEEASPTKLPKSSYRSDQISVVVAPSGKISVPMTSRDHFESLMKVKSKKCISSEDLVVPSGSPSTSHLKNIQSTQQMQKTEQCKGTNSVTLGTKDEESQSQFEEDPESKRVNVKLDVTGGVQFKSEEQVKAIADIQFLDQSQANRLFQQNLNKADVENQFIMQKNYPKKIAIQAQYIQATDFQDYSLLQNSQAKDGEDAVKPTVANLLQVYDFSKRVDKIQQSAAEEPSRLQSPIGNLKKTKYRSRQQSPHSQLSASASSDNQIYQVKEEPAHYNNLRNNNFPAIQGNADLNNILYESFRNSQKQAKENVKQLHNQQLKFDQMLNQSNSKFWHGITETGINRHPKQATQVHEIQVGNPIQQQSRGELNSTAQTGDVNCIELRGEYQNSPSLINQTLQHTMQSPVFSNENNSNQVSFDMGMPGRQLLQPVLAAQRMNLQQNLQNIKSDEKHSDSKEKISNEINSLESIAQEIFSISGVTPKGLNLTGALSQDTNKIATDLINESSEMYNVKSGERLLEQQPYDLTKTAGMTSMPQNITASLTTINENPTDRTGAIVTGRIASSSGEQQQQFVARQLLEEKLKFVISMLKISSQQVNQFIEASQSNGQIGKDHDRQGLEIVLRMSNLLQSNSVINDQRFQEYMQLFSEFIEFQNKQNLQLSSKIMKLMNNHINKSQMSQIKTYKSVKTGISRNNDPYGRDLNSTSTSQSGGFVSHQKLQNRFKSLKQKSHFPTTSINSVSVDLVDEGNKQEYQSRADSKMAKVNEINKSNKFKKGLNEFQSLNPKDFEIISKIANFKKREKCETSKKQFANAVKQKRMSQTKFSPSDMSSVQHSILPDSSYSKLPRNQNESKERQTTNSTNLQPTPEGEAIIILNPNVRSQDLQNYQYNDYDAQLSPNTINMMNQFIVKVPIASDKAEQGQNQLCPDQSPYFVAESRIHAGSVGSNPHLTTLTHSQAGSYAGNSPNVKLLRSPLGAMNFKSQHLNNAFPQPTPACPKKTIVQIVNQSLWRRQELTKEQLVPVGLKEGLKGLPKESHLLRKPKQPGFLIQENDTEKKPKTIDQVPSIPRVEKLSKNGNKTLALANSQDPTAPRQFLIRQPINTCPRMNSPGDLGKTFQTTSSQVSQNGKDDENDGAVIVMVPRDDSPFKNERIQSISKCNLLKTAIKNVSTTRTNPNHRILLENDLEKDEMKSIVDKRFEESQLASFAIHSKEDRESNLCVVSRRSIALKSNTKSIGSSIGDRDKAGIQMRNGFPGLALALNTINTQTFQGGSRRQSTLDSQNCSIEGSPPFSPMPTHPASNEFKLKSFSPMQVNQLKDLKNQKLIDHITLEVEKIKVKTLTNQVSPFNTRTVSPPSAETASLMNPNIHQSQREINPQGSLIISPISKQVVHPKIYSPLQYRPVLTNARNIMTQQQRFRGVKLAANHSLKEGEKLPLGIPTDTKYKSSIDIDGVGVVGKGFEAKKSIHTIPTCAHAETVHMAHMYHNNDMIRGYFKNVGTGSSSYFDKASLSQNVLSDQTLPTCQNFTKDSKEGSQHLSRIGRDRPQKSQALFRKYQIRKQQMELEQQRRAKISQVRVKQQQLVQNKNKLIRLQNDPAPKSSFNKQPQLGSIQQFNRQELISPDNKIFERRLQRNIKTLNASRQEMEEMRKPLPTKQWYSPRPTTFDMPQQHIIINVVEDDEIAKFQNTFSAFRLGNRPGQHYNQELGTTDYDYQINTNGTNFTESEMRLNFDAVKYMRQGTGQDHRHEQYDQARQDHNNSPDTLMATCTPSRAAQHTKAPNRDLQLADLPQHKSVDQRSHIESVLKQSHSPDIFGRR